MGFTEVLTVVFIVLKLIEVIDWSWWLVLLPELVSLPFYVLIVVLVIVNNSSYRRRGGKW